MSEKLKNLLRNFFLDCENIHFWKFILTFIPPLFFAWPLLSGSIPYPFSAVITLQGNNTMVTASSTHEFKLLGAAENIGSQSFFSIFPRVTTVSSMPVEVCFKNQNRIMEDGKEISPLSLVDSDEAGAMSFRYKQVGVDLGGEVYIKLGENKCVTLPSSGVVLLDAEIRSPLPIKATTQTDGKRVSAALTLANRYVDVHKSPGNYHIIWKNITFFQNYLLFLLAWWAVLGGLNKAFEFTLKKGEKNENGVSRD